MNNTLLDYNVIQIKSSNIELLPEQISAARAWLEFMYKGKLDNEKNAYTKFHEYILRNLIGLSNTGSEDGRKKYYIEHEECRQEFLIKTKNEEIVIGIETKGFSTKNLFKKIGKLSPVEQAQLYMLKNQRQYEICTNFDTFLLLSNYNYYQFDFNSINQGTTDNIDINHEKLKEFVFIFSNCLFPDGDIDSIQSIIEQNIETQQKITKDFYKLYHDTRIKLINDFEKNGCKKPVRNAQRLLDQLLFIMYVEDKEIINNEKILHDGLKNMLVNKKLFSDNTTFIFNVLNTVIKKYTDGLKVNGSDFKGFNGELFSMSLENDAIFYDVSKTQNNDHSYIKKSKTEKNDMLKTISSIPFCNPIIYNLVKLDSYDFQTEGSIEMIGRVFEQSVSDLEALNDDIKLKRKDEGVYYTPSFITEYIARSTILGYLSKTGEVINPKKLVFEYTLLSKEEGINELEKKINRLNVMDPSCGSGAFLTAAADIIVEIRKEINNVNLTNTRTLDPHIDSKEFRKFSTTHVYGVDISRHALEIAKLSLFFKMASLMRLPKLSENFKNGDSLIARCPDKLLEKIGVPKKMDWPSEFKNKQFNVIVGNPPWNKMKASKNDFYGPLYEKETGESFRSLSKNEQNKYIKKMDLVYKEKFKQWEQEHIEKIRYVTDSDEYKHIQSIKKDGGKMTSGDLNTYQLFVERAVSLLEPEGYMGMVLPTALFLDDGSTALRKMLLEDTRIKEIFSFKNKYTGQQKIFPAVHPQYKFCIIILRKKSKYAIALNETRRKIINEYDKIDDVEGKLDADKTIKKSMKTLTILIKKIKLMKNYWSYMYNMKN